MTSSALALTIHCSTSWLIRPPLITKALSDPPSRMDWFKFQVLVSKNQNQEHLFVYLNCLRSSYRIQIDLWGKVFVVLDNTSKKLPNNINEPGEGCNAISKILVYPEIHGEIHHSQMERTLRLFQRMFCGLMSSVISVIKQMEKSVRPEQLASSHYWVLQLWSHLLFLTWLFIRKTMKTPFLFFFDLFITY